MNIAIILLLLAVGLSGAWYHWIEVQKRGEAGSFFDYFFRSNTNGSTATVVAFVASMETVYIAGGFNGLQLTPVIEAFSSGQLYPPLVTAVGLAFTAGYACDSKLNSGAPSVPQSPKAQASEIEAQPEVSTQP